MPTWQIRLLDRSLRLVVRRRTWGDDEALARRARRVFGAPAWYGRLRARGLHVERVAAGGPPGEWIVPPNAWPGVVLYVHGGGFVSCSPATHRPITAALARLTRRRVLAIDYRLAPEHRFPAALDDVVAAYRWLLDAHVAPRAIALAGDSAGGGLVLSLLQHARDVDWPLPACAVCLSPWTDLAGESPSQSIDDARDAMLHPQNLAPFAHAYLGDVAPHDPRASPVRGDFTGLPPLLFQVGSTELLLDDARRAHERALAAGVASHLATFDGVPHGWTMLDGLVPEARAALAEAAAFVNDAFAARPASLTP